MRSLTPWKDVTLLWNVFTVYFALSVRGIKVKKSAAFLAFPLESCGILVAGLLVLWPKTHVAALGIRFHNDFAVEMAGLFMTIAGLAFAAWSRAVLGRNWSARALIQVGHELVRTGPYAYVRHPLYTGLLIALTGSMLVSGETGALAGWVASIGIFAIKGRREEHLLAGEFGARYCEYRERTGFLLPRISHV